MTLFQDQTVNVQYAIDKMSAQRKLLDVISHRDFGLDSSAGGDEEDGAGAGAKKGDGSEGKVGMSLSLQRLVSLDMLVNAIDD